MNEKNEKKFGPSDSLVKYFKKKSTEWAPYRRNLIDSHCHFDMLFDNNSLCIKAIIIVFGRNLGSAIKKTVKSYFEDFKEIYLDNFEACVNIICDPRRYEKEDRNKYLTSLTHVKVRSSIGCHPHFSNFWTKKTEEIIVSLIGTNGIVAIGKCGLDASEKNTVSYEQQVIAFQAQLNIANQRNVPLVIHCRDAEAKVFEIMKKNLSPAHRIHLHCFAGGWEMGKQYLDHFSNLCIGLTPLITYRGNNRMIELAQNAPIDRLLLETDAPYFVPYDVPYQFSHPAFVFATTEELATMRNEHINNILDINRRNVNKVYGF